MPKNTIHSHNSIHSTEVNDEIMQNKDMKSIDKEPEKNRGYPAFEKPTKNRSQGAVPWRVWEKDEPDERGKWTLQKKGRDFFILCNRASCIQTPQHNRWTHYWQKNYDFCQFLLRKNMMLWLIRASNSLLLSMEYNFILCQKLLHSLMNTKLHGVLAEQKISKCKTLNAFCLLLSKS